MPQKNLNTLYWPELDGLRAVAFLLVFFSHYPPNASTPLLLGICKYCSWGWVGVDLFFVLSGFLITFLLVKEKFSFGKISIWRFYVRRALRIWPLYFLMLSIISIYPATLHHWNSQYRVFFQSVMAPFFLFAGNYAMIWKFGVFHEFCESWGLNFTLYVGLLVPLWSLCIEEQFYVFWPGILSASRSPRVIWAVISLLFIVSFSARLILVGAALKNNYSHSYYYMDTFFHLDALMVGAAVAVSEYFAPGWFARFSAGARGWLVMAGISIVLLSIPMSVASIYEKHISIVPTMTVIALCFGGLLLLTKNWNPLRLLLSNPVLISIGKVSFAMYVFHLFIARYLDLLLPAFSTNPLANWLIRAFIILVATWIAAQISWHLMESRLLSLRARFTRVPAESSMSVDQRQSQDVSNLDLVLVTE
jgi:peptidoglycan/LPS O-acetylase OafA/YrhL